MAGARRRAVALFVFSAVLSVACSTEGGAGPSGSAETSASSSPAATITSTSAPPGPPAFEPRVYEGLEPVPVRYPAQPSDVPWPTDEWPEGDLPQGVDPIRLEEVLDRAFGELSTPSGYTKAVLVVHGGRLVVERYGRNPGTGERFGPDTIMRSWSMAKSVLATLVGILVAEGKIDIYAPAPVPEWSDPEDPRHRITVDMLLRMSSGLEWKEDYFDFETSDVLAMLVGEGRRDMGAYAASKPLAAEPDTTYYYSTGTSNIISRIVADIVGRGEEYRRFVEEKLTGPLGIDEVVMDFDEAGVWNAGSVFNTTARNFAKLGLLHLRDGVWEGRRILPRGWVDYVRTPTHTLESGAYGAHWWIYRPHPGAFAASGFQGQNILVVPDLDLVVVVLSERLDNRDQQVVDEVLGVFEVLGAKS